MTAALASLPVLMYHYVSTFAGPINVTPEHFEQHCRGMAEHGWRGIGLDEAEACLRGETRLPPKAALMTFDDGFLDNYVHAAPLLEKYGHQGAVFVVTERIEPDGPLRPTLADVWSGRIPAAGLPPVDAPLARHPLGYDYRRDLFMNWAEARDLERRGVARVAAHTARHLSVFAAPDFPARPPAGLPPDARAAARFHTPGRRGNTFYRIEGDVPWGLPRFAEQPAMAGPAFLPSFRLIRAVRDLVPQDKAGARAFFRQADNVDALHDLVESFGREERGGRESVEAERERVRRELRQCRDTLEREIGHPVRSLCWPWGRASRLAGEEGRALGFSVFFTTSPGANLPGRTASVRRFKVRDKGWPWLRLRLEAYSRPLVAGAYAWLHG